MCVCVYVYVLSLCQLVGCAGATWGNLFPEV